MPDIDVAVVVPEAARGRALMLAVERLAGDTVTVEVRGAASSRAARTLLLSSKTSSRRHTAEEFPRWVSVTPSEGVALVAEYYDSKSQILVDFGAFSLTCTGGDV